MDRYIEREKKLIYLLESEGFVCEDNTNPLQLQFSKTLGDMMIVITLDYYQLNHYSSDGHFITLDYYQLNHYSSDGHFTAKKPANIYINLIWNRKSLDGRNAILFLSSTFLTQLDFVIINYYEQLIEHILLEYKNHVTINSEKDSTFYFYGSINDNFIYRSRYRSLYFKTEVIDDGYGNKVEIKTVTSNNTVL